MKLWVDGKPGNSGVAVQMIGKGIVKEINRKVASRGVRAVHALRNAELEVLKGQRSGKVYKKPYTHGRASKATQKLKKGYGHQLRGGQLYRASAPGEAPARRLGNLRLHWNGQVKTSSKADGGIFVLAELESQEKYAYYLEKGEGMAPRPFLEPIKEKAKLEIQRIYQEPYT